MKFIFKRGLSLLTALTVCGTLGSGVLAEYRDMPDGWSRPALESAVENRILQGFDGLIDPSGFLTRAQLATVIVRVFGAKNAADISRFIDVSENDWFHDYVAGAIHMGIMNGTGSTTMSPLQNATREQVFTVLAKALRLDDGDTSLLGKFSDYEKTSDYAEGPVAAMVETGYVSGSDGMLLPGAFITREQFAQVLYNIFKAYYSEAGTYSQDADGSVIINSPDVVLENMSVKGDVIIGDGVGDGDVWLSNVEIGGRLLVRGGGVNSIHLNATDAGKITIAKVDGAIRVVIDGGVVSVAEIADGTDKVVIEGGEIGELIVDKNVPVEINSTKLTELKIDSPADVTIGDSVVGKIGISDGADLKLGGKTVVEEVNVVGDGSKLAVGDETKVGELNVSAPAEINVTGETKVDNINISADGTGSVIDTARGSTIGKIDSAADVTVTGNGKVSGISGDGNVKNTSGSEVTPGSSSGTGESLPIHKHDFIEIERTDATCTSDGLITLKCSCGETKTEVIPATGHAEIVDSEAVEATCTKAGVTKASHCGTCGAIISEAEEIPAVGHKEVEVPAVEPTCAEDGHTAGSKCDVCGELLGKTEKIPALGHTEVDIPAVEPTCTEDGQTAGVKCSRCGAVITGLTVIKAAGHDWGNVEVIPNPTGGSATILTWTCKICGQVQTKNTNEVQVAPAASYELSVSEGNLVASITPVNNSNVFSYEIYLSNDGKNWISAGAAWADVAEGKLPSCDIIGSRIVPGTYTKMKIVSFPANGYGRNYALFDCSITVQEGSKSEIEPLFYKTNDGKLLKYVSGIPEGYMGVLSIWKDSGRENILMSTYNDMSYSESNLPYGMETFDDMTSCFTSLDLFGNASISDAHTGTLTVKRGEVLPFKFSDETEHVCGEWEVTTPATTEADGERQRVCRICGHIESEVIDNGIPRVPKADGFEFVTSKNGKISFSVTANDKTNVQRYDVFISSDGGTTWSDRIGYLMTEENALPNWVIVGGFTPGIYNKVKVVSAPRSDYRTNEQIFDCNFAITDGSELNATLKFTKSESDDFEISYDGLSETSLLNGFAIWKDETKSDFIVFYNNTKTTNTKTVPAKILEGQRGFYQIYELTGTVTEGKVEAKIHCSPLKNMELPD